MLVSNFGFLEKYLDLRNQRLLRLYSKAKERIEQEFDIVSLLKSLRNLKINCENQISDKDKVEAFLSNKNAIYIDEGDDDPGENIQIVDDVKIQA